MKLVLDASAAVNAVLPTALQGATLDRLVGADLYAPTLIDTEVLSALARLERTGKIDTEQASAGIAQWSRLPCERISIEPMTSQVWGLRHAIRISDAHYVAVAHFIGAALLTADGRLARAPVRGVSVLLIN